MPPKESRQRATNHGSGNTARNDGVFDTGEIYDAVTIPDYIAISVLIALIPNGCRAPISAKQAIAGRSFGYQCDPANATTKSSEKANANARPSPTATASGKPSRMAFSPKGERTPVPSPLMTVTNLSRFGGVAI
jgi:hypothetical protein